MGIDAMNERPIEFHGPVVEDHGAHKHYKPTPQDLVGKTIIAFECSAVNVWSLRFSDGTAVAIETEVFGPHGIPQMTLCNVCWQDEQS